MTERYWIGGVPAEDDFGQPIVDLFIDGRTKQGPWATMTPQSHARHGVGLGPGRGQAYARQESGRFLRVEG